MMRPSCEGLRDPALVSIGPHTLRNPVVLAPMAGITDAPFRALAWRFGVGYMVSEMVGSSARLWQTEKSRLRRRAAGGGPLAVQIAGGDPETVAEAASRHWREGADVIDINFGCPAKKVCRKAAGSQLLADEGLVARIIEATVRAVPIPVTIKMRTGYSTTQKNAVRIARIAEDLGVAAIAVHGRTRACRFEGPVEHETTAAVKSAVRVPVFANGDIDSVESARRVLAVTGADGVMIGRAALGAPWLPGQIAGITPPLTLATRIAVMREHVGLVHDFYGPSGARVVRKHVQWYLEKLEELGDAESRRALARAFNSLETVESQRRFLVSLTPDLAA